MIHNVALPTATWGQHIFISRVGSSLTTFPCISPIFFMLWRGDEGQWGTRTERLEPQATHCQLTRVKIQDLCIHFCSSPYCRRETHKHVMEWFLYSRFLLYLSQVQKGCLTLQRRYKSPCYWQFLCCKVFWQIFKRWKNPVFPIFGKISCISQ